MAISVGAAIQVPGPIPTPLVDRNRWLWIAVNGSSIELTSFTDDLEIERGMSGIYMPRLRHSRDIIPGQPGQRTRQVVHDLREVAIPLVAASSDYVEMENLIEKLIRYMDPTKGEGILRRVGRDGLVTDLNCRYAGGLEVSGFGASGPILQRFALIFQADDPYWYGQVTTHGYIGGSAKSWFPFPPLELGTANVIGEISVDSDSDVETWPVWTIIGPGVDPILRNHTTGKVTQMSLPGALTSGQKITIDTRPGYKSVTGPDKSSWRQYLSPGSRSLWGLVPGVNRITLTLPNATEDSYISISYRSRLLGPGANKPVAAIAHSPSPTTSSSSSSGLVSETVEEFV